MKYLLLNTASKNNEVLLVDNDFVCYDKCGEKMQATENLLPCIDKMLDKAGLSIDDIDVFSCVSGPGSFTGIRVGISTIRAFAYACRKPCVVMNYFDVLRQNAEDDVDTLVLIADGGNGMKYLTVRDRNSALLAPIYVDNDTLNKFLSQIEEPYRIVSDCLIEGYTVTLRKDDSTDLIKAASALIKKENFTDYSNVIPMYIAKSQAERDKGL